MWRYWFMIWLVEIWGFFYCSSEGSTHGERFLLIHYHVSLKLADEVEHELIIFSAEHLCDVMEGLVLIPHALRRSVSASANPVVWNQPDASSCWTAAEGFCPEQVKHPPLIRYGARCPLRHNVPRKNNTCPNSLAWASVRGRDSHPSGTSPFSRDRRASASIRRWRSSRSFLAQTPSTWNSLEQSKQAVTKGFLRAELCESLSPGTSRSWPQEHRHHQ